MGKIIRKHLIFHGNVQGVGFRYHARHAAEYLGVTGWVRNLYDGSVEMEAQGTIEQIYRLIRMVGEGRFVDIMDVEQREVPVEEQEYGFHVR